MDNQLMTRQDLSIATIEDVAQFLIIAPEQAKAMQAEIRAIKKLGMAKEVCEQKQEELRLVNELFLDAQTRMGELTQEIPKEPGARNDLQPSIPDNTRLKTKTETIKELGFSKDQVSRMERLAKHPDLVEQEKEDARKEDRQPSAKRVLEQIRRSKPESKYKGGGTREYREQMNNIASVVAELYDESPIEFTIFDLVDDIIVNAQMYIKLLENQIKDHAELVKGDSENIVSETIKNKIIIPIEQIRRITNEARA